MGAFIARVSYGRSVREFVLGVVAVPSLLGFVWFATFGGTALWEQLFGGVDMAGALAQGYETVLFRMYDSLPLSDLLAGLSILLLVIFFVTSADSAVLVLGSMSSETAGDPSLARKFAWGIAVALIAATMLLAGGLDALQTLITVAALPFALLMVAVMVGLHRVLSREALREEVRERRARRAIERWIAREQKQKTLGKVSRRGGWRRRRRMRRRCMKRRAGSPAAWPAARPETALPGTSRACRGGRNSPDRSHSERRREDR